MLINLIPEFLAVLQTADREAAFQDYLNAHRSVLSAYWHNYVLDLDSPQASAIVTHSLHADRSDLHELLASTDVEGIVEDAIAQSEDLLQVDRPTDVYLMVGMGAANAGELVVGGRGRSSSAWSISRGGPIPRPTGWDCRRSCCHFGWRTRWRTPFATPRRPAGASSSG